MKKEQIEDKAFFVSQLFAAIFLVLSPCLFAASIYCFREASKPTNGAAAILGIILIPLAILSFILFRILKYTPPKDDKPAATGKTSHLKDIQPLWETVLQNDLETLQKALASGTDINAPYPANGNTPLHIAVWNGYTDMVKFLLAQPGIDKNAKNLAGKTPLDLAEEKQLEEITRLLKN